MAADQARTSHRLTASIDLFLMFPPRQPQPRPAAGPRAPVLQDERAAVGLRDLAAEDEADPRSLRLGREERHEEVPGVGKARPAVVDPDLDLPLARGGVPTELHASVHG